MENPETGGLAEKTVDRVLEDHAEGSETCGLSLTRRITDALRDAGLLLEDRECDHIWEEQSVDTWVCARCGLRE
jgi:hypothetical protein